MSSFNRDKYRRAEEVFQELRSSSRHWESVSRQDAVGGVWRPSEFNISKDYANGRSEETRVIQHYHDFMKNNIVGGTDAIRRQEIGIWYMIMGDVRKDSVMGANTRGVRGVFNWDTMLCTATLSAGVVGKLALTVNSHNMLQSNMTERNMISKATGWDVQAVQQMTVDNITTLSTLTRSAAGGHQKFTRLVKGCLLYMDLLLHGAQRYDDMVPDTIRYNPQDVLNSFRRSNTSYSFCSKPESLPYTIVLGLMGMEYPFPSGRLMCRGSVKVPADADRHVVVCRGNPTVGKVECILTHTTVWTSIVNYAREMRVGHQIESAMITAASLYENRYLREVSLPKVESTIDLIRPMFLDSSEDDSEKPRMDAESMIGVGRAHQMSCLLVGKDMIIAAKNTTRRGFNYESVVSGYLKSQETVVMRMSEWATPLALQKSTSQMRWMGSLTEDDIRDMDSISIFEAFWLCDEKTKSIEKGGIQCLLNGVNDGMVRNGFVDLLVLEMQKFGILVDRRQIPTGRFSVRRRCLVFQDVWEPRVRQFAVHDIKLVMPCDFKQEDRGPARRPRVRRGEIIKAEERGAVPVKDVLDEIVFEELKKAEEEALRFNQEKLLNEEIEREKERERDNEKRRESRLISALRSPDSQRRSFDGKRMVGIELPGMSVAEASVRKHDTRKDSLGQIQFGELRRQSESGTSTSSDSLMKQQPEDQVGEHNEDRTKGLANAQELDEGKHKLPKAKKYVPIEENVLSKSAEEVAFEKGPEFAGQVQTAWSNNTMRAIRSSKGWENFIKGRGINPVGSVFGRPVLEFCNDAIEYDETFSNLRYVISTFMDSRTNVGLEHIERGLSEGTIQATNPLDPMSTDSMESSNLGLGDAIIASWMLNDRQMAESLSKTQRQRLTRHFRMPPHLRAAIMRIDK